jgi:adenylate cyclase
MTKHIEVERRWLIKLPLSPEALKAIETDPDVPARITQTYLKSDDNIVHRVRFIEYDFWGVTQPGHYISTTKRFIEAGVNEEDEHSLNEAEYQAKLLDRDTDHFTIEKTRYHLHHTGHVFELDVFKGELEGLCILELELPRADWEEKITPPPYLNVEREITFEPQWSNFDISARGSLVLSEYRGHKRKLFTYELELCDAVDLDHMQPKGWFARLVDWFRPQIPAVHQYDRISDRQENTKQ